MRNLKKFLALVLATLMVVSAMVATTVSAAEIGDHSEAVDFLNRIDIYRGYGADAMGDKDLVTRWHMALFVSRITTGFTNDAIWNTTTNETPFTDVTKDHYLGAIATAYKAGVIEGVGDNKFDPNANIKYQDALTMIVRALGYTNLPYPAGYIQKAQVLGLTDNLEELDNNLGANITRGQTAELLYNAIFAECKDGTILAEDVLKLGIADAKVVATENQKFGNDALAAKGKVVLEIKAEGSSRLTYKEINASELLKDGETSDDILGYTFKVATNNNYKTLVTAYRCDTKVLVNYGTTKADITPVQQGYSTDRVYRKNMIKLNGTNYNWGTEAVSGDKFIAVYALVDGAYTLIENGKSDLVWNNKFCELKVIDTDFNGVWDTAFFTPYSIGVYGTVNSPASNYVTNFATDKVAKDANKALIAINGEALPAYAGATKYVGALESAVAFEGKKPAAGDTIIYTFNPFTGVFTVVENLGAYKTGTVTDINGNGSYTVIGGAKYIYDLTPANLNGFAGVNTQLLTTALYDKLSISYLAVDGYLVDIKTSYPYGYTSFAAFTWSDMTKIDANGNLVVKAIIDATGDKKEIAIADVEGFKVGLAMNEYLKANGLVTGNAYWVGSSAPTATNADLKNALGYANTLAGATVLPSNFYAAKYNADGTYSLVAFTPDVNYDPINNKNDKDLVNIVNNKTVGTITLNYGINDQAYVSSVAADDKLIATANKFATTSDATYVFVGANDIHVFKGVAPNGAKIYLADANTYLINATANCVFVVNKTVAVEDLYYGFKVDAGTTTTTKDYVFYAVVAGTRAAITTSAEAGKSTLTVTGLYNVLTGATVDVVVTDNIAANDAIFQAINAKWTISGYSQACAKLILFSKNEKRFELSDDVFTAFGEYLNEYWSNHSNKVVTGVELGNQDDQYALVAADGTKIPVKSLALTTIWGEDGSVEVVDGVNVKRNFADTKDSATAKEKAYYYITESGNAYGFVFAPGMNKETAK